MLRRYCRLAVSRQLARGRGDFGEHWSLQLHAGPQFGHARRFGQRGRGGGRRRWRSRRLWSRGGTGNLCTRHLQTWRLQRRHLCSWHRGQRRLGGRRRCGQSEALALNFVSLDHRLAQILHVRRRRSWRGRSSRGSRRTRRRGCPGRSHRDDAGFFFYVIEHDGVLRGWIGDHAAHRRVDARLAITRSPHARSRLSRRAAPGRLHLRGALGTRRRHRRRCWQILAHSGHILARPAPVVIGIGSLPKAID